jgi:hypothetical protein
VPPPLPEQSGWSPPGTINGLAGKDYKTATLDRPGPCNRPRVHEDPAVTLTSYPGTVRQLIITGLGRDAPTVIITNDTASPPGR